MNNSAEKLLVLGIGNLLMGDEGVGVQVAQRLAQRQMPAGVECMDGGTGSFFLLDPMLEASRILLIDAAAGDDEPGTIRILEPKFSQDYPRTLTSHDIGLKDLLDSFYLMERAIPVRLIAITIDPQQSLSTELSPPIADAAARVVELAWQQIEQFAAARV